MTRLPDFIVCGAQKAGTTSLFHYLQDHPQISMPKQKEINFFNLNWQKGYTWYKDQFSHFDRAKIIGEVSPLYMWHQEVPQRMAGLVPDAKLIFVLRNPAARAYSNYWFNISRGAQDPNESFSEAIRTQKGYRNYITKGFYYNQIERFLPYFSRGQLYIIISEDLKNNILRELTSCFEYLSVGTDYIPDVQQLHNVTQVAPNAISRNLYQAWCSIRAFLRPVIPTTVRNIAKQIQARIDECVLVSSPPPMSQQERTYLRELFQKQNALLSNFLQRGSPLWE